MVAANRLANLKWSLEKQRQAERELDAIEREPPEVNWMPLWFLLTFIAGMLLGGWD